MIFLYWAHFYSVYYVNANFEFFVCLSFSICFFLFPLLSFSLPWLSFDTKHTRLYNRQTLEPIRTHPERHFIILSALAGFSWFLFFKDFSWTIRYEEPKKKLLGVWLSLFLVYLSGEGLLLGPMGSFSWPPGTLSWPFSSYLEYSDDPAEKILWV